MNNRRDFLKIVSMLPATAIFGSLVACGGGEGGLTPEDGSLSGLANDDGFWDATNKLFTSNTNSVVMNIDTLATTPTVNLIARSTVLGMAANVPTVTTLPNQRAQLARLLNVGEEQLALVDSATVALMLVISGFQWQPGDVVLTTSQEHPSTLAQLAIAQSVYGIEIKFIEIDLLAPFSGDEVVSRFENAITDLQKAGKRPRAIIWSSPTYLTGAMIPPILLARLALRHGLFSICDGAHLLGMVDFNVDAIGADVIVSSGSKWQAASKGTGVIFINKRHLGRDLFPNLIQPSFRDAHFSTGGLSTAAKLSIRLNTRESSFNALVLSCETWNSIGRDKITRYILSLNQYLRLRIEQKWGSSSVYSRSAEPDCCSGLLTFSPFGRVKSQVSREKVEKFVGELATEHGFVVKPMRIKPAVGKREEWAVRISTPLWVKVSDVDNLVAAIEEVSTRG